jgi:KRAB domain-containing zinc finger protein
MTSLPDGLPAIATSVASYPKHTISLQSDEADIKHEEDRQSVASTACGRQRVDVHCYDDYDNDASLNDTCDDTDDNDAKLKIAGNTSNENDETKEAAGNTNLTSNPRFSLRTESNTTPKSMLNWNKTQADRKVYFVCPHCTGLFERGKEHEMHMKQHIDMFTVGEDGSHLCNFCQTLTKNFKNFCKHAGLKACESVCTVCKESVATKCELTTHLQKHNKERLKKLRQKYCEVCNETMEHLDTIKFSEHLKEHKKEEERRRLENEDGKAMRDWKTKNFLCPLCKQLFLGSVIMSHMKTHSELLAVDQKERYKCTYCPATFKEISYLYEHLRTPEGKNFCVTCNKHLNSRCEVSAHKRRHKLEKENFCEWCGIALTELSALQFAEHRREHEAKGEEKKRKRSVDVRAVCSICGKGYQDSSGLKLHMKRSHSSEEPFACDYPGCSRAYKTKSDLSQHVVVHGEKTEVCELCGKKYHRSKDLKSHMRVAHLEGRKFKCLQCPKSFKQSFVLKAHVNAVHEGIRRFTCGICQKQFSSVGNLKQHKETVHSDSRPFSCHQCNLTYKSKASLDKHILRHTNAQPFQCHDCGVRYSNRSSYVAHRKQKHSDSVYSCTVCAANFPIMESLKFHLKINHSQETVDEVKCLSASSAVFQENNDVEGGGEVLASGTGWG